MNTQEWIRETPTVPNTFWWFYGYLNEAVEKPELMLVGIFKENNNLRYFGFGGALYPNQEGVNGVWKPLELPNVSIDLLFRS